ncbi:MAG: hypothetical protein ABF868_04815 [Sporolactobacillus sp.]
MLFIAALLIIGLVALAVVMALGGLLVTALIWIPLGLVALFLFIFFRFLFKWAILALLIYGGYKLFRQIAHRESN